MGETVGCLLNASAASPEKVKQLVASLGVTTLFIRGAVRLPGLHAKIPVSPDQARVPGFELSDDDSVFRAALEAGRDANLDVYAVLSNPLEGSPNWTDLIARDNGGRSAAEIDGERPALCPNRPKLLKWLTAAATELAKTYKPTGVLLEDFAIGTSGRIDSLFMCWCDVCQSRAAELGYDADRLRLSMQSVRTKLSEARPGPAALAHCGIVQYIEAIGYDAGIIDWLNFRADSISSCLYEVRQALAKLDPALRVCALTRAPSVAILAGQRRLDILRDTTLADACVPVICGPASHLLDTITGISGILRGLLPDSDENTAFKLAGGLIYSGCRDLTVPDAACEHGAHFLRTLVPRELDLALSGAGQVPRWPAIDVRGLTAETVSEIAQLVRRSTAAGLVYVGVPA